jgi:hypothetical protein
MVHSEVGQHRVCRKVRPLRLRLKVGLRTSDDIAKITRFGAAMVRGEEVFSISSVMDLPVDRHVVNAR